jgi:hypothetical protein
MIYNSYYTSSIEPDCHFHGPKRGILDLRVWRALGDFANLKRPP